MSLEVAVTDDPSDEALDLIGSGLDQFNLNAAGYADRRTLAVLVTDPASGEVVGGAYRANFTRPVVRGSVPSASGLSRQRAGIARAEGRRG